MISVIFGCVLVLLIGLGVFLYLHSVRKKRREINQQAQRELQEKEQIEKGHNLPDYSKPVDGGFSANSPGYNSRGVMV